jgi:hypothetical protein
MSDNKDKPTARVIRPEDFGYSRTENVLVELDPGAAGMVTSAGIATVVSAPGDHNPDLHGSLSLTTVTEAADGPTEQTIHVIMPLPILAALCGQALGFREFMNPAIGVIFDAIAVEQRDGWLRNVREFFETQHR